MVSHVEAGGCGGDRLEVGGQLLLLLPPHQLRAVVVRGRGRGRGQGGGRGALRLQRHHVHPAQPRHRRHDPHVAHRLGLGLRALLPEIINIK